MYLSTTFAGSYFLSLSSLMPDTLKNFSSVSMTTCRVPRRSDWCRAEDEAGCPHALRKTHKILPWSISFSGSMSGTARKLKRGTSFRLAISKTFIAPLCSRSGAELASMAIPTSKTQPQSCNANLSRERQLPNRTRLTRPKMWELPISASQYGTKRKPSRIA